MRKQHSFRRKGLALLLAGFMTVTSLGLPGYPPIRTVQAEENEAANALLPADAEIVQIFQAPAGGYSTLKSVQMDVQIISGATVSKVKVYHNLNDIDDYYGNGREFDIDGFKVSGNKDIGQKKQTLRITDLTSSDSDAALNLMPNEWYAVGFTLISSNAEGTGYYPVSNSAVSYINNGQTSFDLLTVNTDGTISGEPDDVTLALTDSSRTTACVDLSQTINLSDYFTMDPSGLKRTVTYTSGNTAILTVSANGTVKPKAVGSTTVTAAHGSSSQSVTVYVVDPVLSNPGSTYTYNGSSQKAPVTANGMGTDYTLTYTDTEASTDADGKGDAVAAGRVDISVEGRSPLNGYSKTLNYEIGKLDIQPYAEAASITVDAAGKAHVSNLVGPGKDAVGLSEVDADGRGDYSISTVETGSTASGSTYDVTISGENNYTGSYTRPVTSTYDATNLADISEKFDFTLDQDVMPYAGFSIQPGLDDITITLKSDAAKKPLDLATKKKIFELVPVANGENTEVGDGVLTIRGLSSAGYTGEVALPFYIAENDINANYSASDKDQKAGTIHISVKDGSFTASDDKTTATLSKNFVHGDFDLSDLFTITMYQWTDNGTSHTYTLSENDYTVWSDESDPGAIGTHTGTLHITGQGNFTGEWAVTYTVVADIAKDLTVKTYNNKRLVGTTTATVTADGSVYNTPFAVTYDGNAVTPTFGTNFSSNFIVSAGKILKPGTDYEVASSSYKNNTDAGTASVVLKGKGAYAGKTATLTFTINRKAVTSADKLTIDAGSYTYVGPNVEVTPADDQIHVTLNGGKDPLKNGKKQYKITGVSNNTEAGTATVTAVLNDDSNFSGSLTGTYTIAPLDLSNPPSGVDFTIHTENNDQDSWPVEGTVKDPKAVEPKVTSVTYNNGGTTITLDPKDYTVSYENNTKVGTNTAKIVVTGKGSNLKGSVKKSFSIVKKDFQNLSITLDGTDAEKSASRSTSAATYYEAKDYAPKYKGAAYTPSLTIENGGDTLILGTDYKLSWDNNEDAGKYDDKMGPHATITGINNYSGSTAFIYFTIQPMELKEAWVSDDVTIASDGTPTLSVVRPSALGDRTLSLVKDGKGDYSIEPDNDPDNDREEWPINAGMHTVKITGNGNYTGTIKKTYQKGRSLSGVSVSLVNPYPGVDKVYDAVSGVYQVPYLGEDAILGRPALRVTDSYVKDGNPTTVTLKKDVDYTVTYTTDPSNISDATTAVGVTNASGSLVYVVLDMVKDSQTYFGSNSGIRYKVNPVPITNINTNKDTIAVGQIYATDDTPNADKSKVPGRNFAYYYNGMKKEVTPELIYYPGGKDNEGITLTPGTDYDYSTSSISADVNAAGSSYLLPLTGKGNYSAAFNMPVTVIKTPLYLGATYSGTTLIAAKPSIIDGQETYTVDGTGYALQYTGQALCIEDLGLKFGLTEDDAAVKESDATFHVTWANNQKPSSDEDGYATATLTPANDNYSGSLIVKYAIAHLTIDPQYTTVSDSLTYNGKRQEPTIIVKDKESTLTRDVDYTVYYEDSAGKKITDGGADAAPYAPGLYNAVITPAGVYKGSASYKKSFTIYGDIEMNSDLFEVDGSPSDQEFTMTLADGKLVSQELTDYMNSKYKLTRKKSGNIASDTATELVEGGNGDYKVTMDLPNKPGTGTVKVTGQGFYKGTLKYTVTMQGSLKDAEIKFGSDQYAYNGGQVRPNDVRVMYKGQNLVEGTDYIITYSDNADVTTVGTKSLTISPGTNKLYGDEKTAAYEVKYDLSTAKVNEKKSQEYDYIGSEITFPDLTVSCGGRPIELNLLTVAYANNVNPGQATVTITPKDASSPVFGEAIWKFNIKQISLKTNATITFNDGEWGDGIAEDAKYEYSGKEIRPEPKVLVTYTDKDNKKLTKTLTSNDYTVEYSNNKNKGTATIRVTGNGQYGGYKDFSFTITPHALTSDMVEVVTPVYYAGSATPIPVVNVTFNGETLSTKDYTTSVTKDTNYESNMKCKVTVSGKGNFSGDYTEEFTVAPRDLGDGKVIIPTESKEVTYTGSSVEDELKKIDVQVDKGDGTMQSLKRGKEYTLTVNQKGNGGADVVTTNSDGTLNILRPDLLVDVSDFQITIDAVEPHFTGQLLDEFKIVPKSLEVPEDGADDFEISLDKEDNPYTGAKVTPTVTVKDNGRVAAEQTLVLKKDYTVTYENNVDAAGSYEDKAPTLVVTGSGNYTGVRRVHFNIGTKLTADNTRVNVLGCERAPANDKEKTHTYDGMAHTPKVEVIYNKTTLKNLADDAAGQYEVKYVGSSLGLVDGQPAYDGDTIHVGQTEQTQTKVVTITGKNGYYGTVTGTYKIRPKKANNIKIVPVLDYDADKKEYYTIYDGKAATPDAIVYDLDISDSVPLDSEGANDAYDITGYENNTTATTGEPALIKVTMKGDYADTAMNTQTAPFTIRGKALTDYAANLADAPDVKRENDLKSPGAYYKYTGSEIYPNVQFTNGGEVLPMTAGKDYSITYVESDAEGNPVYEEVEDADGNTIRQLKKVSPVNAGLYVAVVEGKGNYSGTWNLPYYIYADLKDAEVSDIEPQFYQGLGQDPHPEISVKLAGNTLTEAKKAHDDVEAVKGDYYRDPASDTNFKSDGKIVLTSARDYYTGTKTVSYEISTDGKYLTAEIDGKAYTYTGYPIGDDIKITLPNGTVVFDAAKREDYPDTTITYEEVKINPDGDDKEKIEVDPEVGPIEAGIVTATITNITAGSETGLTKTVRYSILQKNINSDEGATDNTRPVTVRMPISRTYDGSAQEVKPVIWYNGLNLKEGVDYTLSYANNIEPGTATVMIKGINNFKNDRYETFVITPAPVYNLEATPTSASSVKLTWNHAHNVTGYEINSGGDHQKYYGTTSSNSFEVIGLESGKTYQFSVRSYTMLNGEKKWSEWSEVTAMTDIAAPSDVKGGTGSKGTATISWSKSANVDGYAVYRATSLDGNYALAATVPLRYGSYTDRYATSGKTYYYRVRGYKSDGNGGWIYGSYSSPIAVTAQ